MRIKLQLVICSDDGQEETITDVVTLQKDSQRIDSSSNFGNQLVSHWDSSSRPRIMKSIK